MSNQNEAGVNQQSYNSSISSPKEKTKPTTAATLQVNQLLRRIVNVHDTQKQSSIVAAEKSIAVNPIDNAGNAVIFDGALQSAAAENMPNSKRLNLHNISSGGGVTNNQGKWPANNQSLVSLLNSNQQTTSGNYSDPKKKPQYYRNSLNTRVYHNTNQLGTRVQQEEALEVGGILKIGAIHPPQQRKLTVAQPSFITSSKDNQANYRMANGAVQNTIDPKLALAPQKFRTSEGRGDHAKYLQSVDANSLSSGIQINNVMFGGGKQPNQIVLTNQIATMIQKKSNKSICLPIIKSPKQNEGDDQMNPMNTKHFDKLKHFADYSGSGMTEKSTVDFQVMRPHQSSNLLNHYINNKSTHPHLHSLKLPEKMRTNQQTALQGSHSNMGRNNGANNNKYFQRSESTDYRLNPSNHHQIANIGFRAGDNRHTGFLTSKKIGMGSKIHSIEVTPSRMQQRKSPFTYQGGQKLVTDDILNIQQIQQNHIHNSAKRPDENNYQQIYNKKLSVSQQGPYLNEADSDQTPTKLKKHFHNIKPTIHSVAPTQTLPPQMAHQLLPHEQLAVMMPNLNGPEQFTNSGQDEEHWIQSLHLQQQQKWLQSQDVRQHNYKIKIAKKSEPIQNVQKILENAEQQKNVNFSMLQQANVQQMTKLNQSLITKNNHKLSQQDMRQDIIASSIKREKSPVEHVMRSNQTKFQQYLINQQFEKRSSLAKQGTTTVRAHAPADAYNSADGPEDNNRVRAIEEAKNNTSVSYFEHQIQGEYSQEQASAKESQRATKAGAMILYSSEHDDKLIYSQENQLQESTQVFQDADGDVSFSPDHFEEDNTQQMFYGDFQCDEDEPPEDDMSNQQGFSNSQFSDNISEGGAESEKQDPDFPTPLLNDSKEDEPESTIVDDVQDYNDEKLVEQQKIQKTEQKQISQQFEQNSKDKELPMNKSKISKEQAKFLDMLQNSKSQKAELQKTIFFQGKTPKLNSRAVKKPSKKKKYASQKSKKIMNYQNEDEESNFDQDINYNSDSNQTGNLSKQDTMPAQLKSLLLRKGEEKITNDMTVQEKYLNKPPNGRIVLNYGPIPGRQPTVFFNYPPFLKLQRPFKSDKILIINQEQLEPYSYLSFKISDQTNTYNCVVNALKTAGFHLVLYGNGPTSYNILWSPLYKAGKLKSFNPSQRINHFPGSWTIGSKASLWRHVQKLRRKHGKDYEICPQTYIFPEDYKRWCNDREMNNFKDLYILKPIAMSCGKGIRVIGKKDKVPSKQGYLVSKYLSKPHLLRGFKYDLRIYIVVTSFEPLKAYIFREGLVRLATQPYSTAKGNLKKRYVHLTNYSINKNAENFVKNDKTGADQTNIKANSKESTTVSSKNDSKNENSTTIKEDEPVESKWSLKMLRQEYTRIGIDYDEIFGKIKELCVKTLISVETEIASNMRAIKQKNNCFEIYGFDVLIDRDFKPWLLEVNVGPSLSSSSPFDKQVKSILLSDTLHLSGFNVFDRKQMLISKKLERQNKFIRNLGQIQANAQADPAASSAQTVLQSKPPRPLKHKYNSPSKKTEASAIDASNTTNISPKKQRAGDTERHHGDYDTSIVSYKGVTSPRHESEENRFHPSHRFKIKDKWAINSFLQGFEFLTEDDLDLLAQFEEEQARRQQTQFERIFPMKDNVDVLSKCFECSRHSNNLVWQYVRQRQPVQYLKAYFKAYPQM